MTAATTMDVLITMSTINSESSWWRIRDSQGMTDVLCPCPICWGCMCHSKRKCTNSTPYNRSGPIKKGDRLISGGDYPEELCYCTTEENGMPYAAYTKKGEPSFNGIDPKIIKFCDYAFGWHKKQATCLKCNTHTHYSLHRRYKFTSNIENFSKIDRIWCCSEECFKSIILEQLFNFTIPPEEAHKILGLTED